MFNRYLKRQNRARRTHVKTRAKGRVRLLIYRSIRAIYAQVIDDEKHAILFGVSNLKGTAGLKGAQEVGKKVAELAKKHKISEVVFDRSGYKYHGQVKALADSAREGGLKF